MSPVTRSLIETAGVTLLACAGVYVGLRFSRLRSRAWIVGYAAPLFVVGIVGVSRWVPSVEQIQPFSWIMAGRTEFALSAVVFTMLLTTPLSRLPCRRQRFGVAAFMVLITAYMSILSFLAPVFAYHELRLVKTNLDLDGVCLQSNGYNCGPAAAVTALRRLGIPAEESALAIRAHTTWIAGTPPDNLAAAIRAEYGVPCRAVYLRSVERLKGREPFIAVVKYSFLVDHYITILSVTEHEVVAGDPLIGLTRLTHDEFENKWRGSAIVFDDSAVRSGD